MQMTSCYLLLLIIVRSSPCTRIHTDVEESQSILKIENIFEFQAQQKQMDF